MQAGHGASDPEAPTPVAFTAYPEEGDTRPSLAPPAPTPGRVPDIVATGAADLHVSYGALTESGQSLMRKLWSVYPGQATVAEVSP
jgi:hypothetical protein